MEIIELMEIADLVRYFVSFMIILFMLMLGLKTISEVMNPYRMDISENSISTIVIIETILAYFLGMVNYNFFQTQKKLL